MKKTTLLVLLTLAISVLSLGFQPTMKSLTIINKYDYPISVSYQWKDTNPIILGEIAANQERKSLNLINNYDRKTFGCSYQLPGADRDAHIFIARNSNGDTIYEKTYFYNQLKSLQFIVTIKPDE